MFSKFLRNTLNIKTLKVFKGSNLKGVQHKSENGLNFVLKYKNALFKILSSFDRNDKKSRNKK